MRHQTLRAVALLPAGAFAVHQLRFTLAFGHGAGRELAKEGHGYLSSLAPALIVVVVLSLAGYCLRLASGRGDGRASRMSRLWPAMSGLLLSAYVVQETLEGLLASGHPGGLAGIVGGGGWLALPLSLIAGLLISLALRGAARAPELLRRRERLRAPAAPAPLVVRLAAPIVPRLRRTRRRPAARGPPVICR